jgi:hypothetical protein
MLLRNTIFQLFTISQRDTSATTERWLWKYSSSWCQCWKKCFRVWIKKTPHPSKKEGQKWIVDVRYINTVLTLNVANTNQGEWTTCQKRFMDMLFLNTAWRLMSRNAKITVKYWILTKMKHNELGKLGEEMAVEFLLKTDILFWRPIGLFKSRNWYHCPKRKIHLLLLK